MSSAAKPRPTRRLSRSAGIGLNSSMSTPLGMMRIEPGNPADSSAQERLTAIKPSARLASSFVKEIRNGRAIAGLLRSTECLVSTVAMPRRRAAARASYTRYEPSLWPCTMSNRFRSSRPLNEVTIRGSMAMSCSRKTSNPPASRWTGTGDSTCSATGFVIGGGL